MKLLHIQARQVVRVVDSDLPPYAVLSYTGGYRDVSTPGPEQPVHDEAVRVVSEIALSRGIAHLWVDSLCVDTASSADLDEAVNGAYLRLRRCAVCLTHLDDLPADGPPFDKDVWARCRYWKRAWTLQELLVPPRVEFFDEQWNNRGARTGPGLLSLLPNITGLPHSVLLGDKALSEISTAERLSWAAGRASSRQEDVAYSLVAIMGVTLSVRYGEGAERAFLRLQEEILHDTLDGSIFAWRGAGGQGVRGLLARSPSEFDHLAAASGAAAQGPWDFDGKVRFSSKGISIHALVSKHGSCVCLDIGRLQTGDRVGVYLREWQGVYFRVDAGSETYFSTAARRRSIDVARDVDGPKASRIVAHFNASDADSLPFSQATTSLTTHQPSSGSHDTDYQDVEEASCFEAELDDLFSSESSGSDDDLHSDSVMGSNSPGSIEGLPLDVGPELESMRLDLTRIAYQECRAWMLSARYGVPPEDRLAPSKRARTARGRPPLLLTWSEDDRDDVDDAQFVVISQLDGYLHLACPFYVSNPQRYRTCLARHDLQCIEDITSHLRRHHAEPPYCPVCRRAFDCAAERDGHVRGRTCELRASGGIEGISKRQASRLGKRDRLYFGEVRRWLRIWDTVFPGVEYPRRSPYLEHSVERDVSMVHDFWAGSGAGCISQYLESRGHEQLDGETSFLAALYQSVLQGLLDMVLEGKSAYQEGAEADRFSHAETETEVCILTKRDLASPHASPSSHC